MSTKRLSVIVAAMVFVFSLSMASTASAASTTLYYPTQDKADFSIKVPNSWTVDPAEEEGGFVSVTGPTGIQLSFRTIEADNDQVKAAIEQSFEWVGKNYSSVKMDDPSDATENGLKGFSTAGTAKDKSDGHQVVIVMEWLALNETHLAEVWMIVDATDQAGIDAAGSVMKSLRAR